MVLSLQLRAVISGLSVVNQKLIREDVKNIPMGEPLVLKGIGVLTMFLEGAQTIALLVFLAAMSSSRSDDVTQLVFLCVRVSVCPLFFLLVS